MVINLKSLKKWYFRYLYHLNLNYKKKYFQVLIEFEVDGTFSRLLKNLHGNNTFIQQKHLLGQIF